jgi:hypothetical protein
LGVHGCPEVQRVAPEDCQVVSGRLVSPFEAEFGRVRRRLGGVEDAGQSIGESRFGKARERRVDVRKRARRQWNQVE